MNHHGGLRRHCVLVVLNLLVVSTGSAQRLAAPPQPLPGAQRLRNGAMVPFAQFRVTRGSSDNDGELERVFVPPPRDLRRSWSRAKEAIEQQRFSDAVLELDALLNGPGVEDFFIESEASEGTRASLKSEIRRLLGSLPAAGRDAYELQFGAEARRLLDEALQAGDLDKLTEVSRKYFHTRAGYEATLLAGHYYLNLGQPLTGALFLKRFEQAPHATGDLEPELSLLLATCWRCANNSKAAERTLVRLQRQMPQATITVGGRTVRIFPSGADALAWLDTIVATGVFTRLSEASEWLLHRGNPARNASAQGTPPLQRCRWRVPVANDWEDEQHVRKLMKQYVDGGVPALPQMQPLAVDNVVLMRSPDKLLAVDLAGGKRIWVYPWDQEFSSWGKNAAYGKMGWAIAAGPSGRGLSQPNRQEMVLHQRVWEDAAYGQLASDGDCVYVLDELDTVSFRRGATPRFVPNVGIGRPQASGPPCNRLVALDLKTQGKLRWAIGSAQDGDPGDEPRLAETFFLGPPLPLSGQLYILAESKGEVRLAVLDAKTGRLEWSQQLAHFEAPQDSIAFNSIRRLSGATPSFADGVLVCPVMAGAVVAVDVATRSLLWGYQYRTYFNEGPRSSGVWNRGFVVPSQLRPAGQRWADATATLADGRVVVTPADSDQLHCLDFVTGKPVWPPQARGDNLFVACAHRGVAVLVGKNQVTAVRLDDGKPAWNEPATLSSGAMPSGRGFLTGDQYYLPTTAPELVRIDITNGHVDAKRTESALGNLVCYRGQIISQSGQWLETFFQEQHLQQLVDRRLQQKPDDPWALEHLAMLLIYRGRYGDALPPLRRALQLYSQEDTGRDSARALLVDTLLDALRNDFRSSQHLASELDQLVDRPTQRDEYLRLMAKGFEENGKLVRAFELYVQIADSLSARAEMGQAEFLDGKLQVIDRNWQVDHRRWLCGAFGRLFERAPTEQQEHMLGAVQQRLQVALDTDTVAALGEFVSFFGALPMASRARLRLAETLVDAEQLLDAELILKRLVGSSETSLAASAVALMADLLAKAGRLEEAASCYRILAGRYANVVCHDGRTGRQIVQAFLMSRPASAPLNAAQDWPTGHVDVEEKSGRSSAQSQNSPFRLYSMPYSVTIDQYDSTLPDGMRIVLSRQLNALGIMDGLGRLRRHVTLDQSSYSRSVRNYQVAHAKMLGHLMVVSLGMEIVAIDTLSAADPSGTEVLWSENVDARPPGIASSRSALRATPQTGPWGISRYVAVDRNGKPVGIVGTVSELGICFQVGKQLRCVDWKSNQPMWVRNDVDAGCDLFGDDQMVFVVPPGSTTARVFSRIDGQEMPSRSVPPEAQRLKTQGRQIVAYERQVRDGRQEMTLRLFDPWTNTDVWSHRFAVESKGSLLETGEIGVMQPDGRFVLISALDGDKIIDTMLEPEKTLDSIYVMRSVDQYILITSRGASTAPTTTIRTVPMGTHPRRVNGRVYALDRHSGQPLWPVPAYIENYDLPIDQPANLPILVFQRQVAVTGSGRPRRSSTSILCIDRRDGRQLLAADNPNVARALEVTGDADEKTVTLRLLNSKTYTLRFTNQPRAPQPPVQTGSASSLTGNASSGRLTKVAEAIFKAIGRQAEQMPQPAIGPKDLQKILDQVPDRPALQKGEEDE